MITNSPPICTCNVTACNAIYIITFPKRICNLHLTQYNICNIHNTLHSLGDEITNISRSTIINECF